MTERLDIRNRFRAGSEVEQFINIHYREFEGLAEFTRVNLTTDELSEELYQITSKPLSRELANRMKFTSLHWQAVMHRDVLPIVFAGYVSEADRLKQDLSNSLGLIVVERKLEKLDGVLLAKPMSVSYSGVVKDSKKFSRPISVRFNMIGTTVGFDVAVTTEELSDIGNYKESTSTAYAYTQSTKIMPHLYLYGEEFAGSTTSKMLEKFTKDLSVTRALIVKPTRKSYFGNKEYVEGLGFSLQREQKQYKLSYESDKEEWYIEVPVKING